MEKEIQFFDGASVSVAGIDDLGHRVVEMKIQSGDVTYVWHINIKQASQLGLALLSPKRELL